MQNSVTASGGRSSPTFMFEGPDGVNMDGLLSDSNDSSSSSMTDIGPGVNLNMLTNHGSLSNNSSHTNGSHHHQNSHNNSHHHHLLNQTNGQQQLNHTNSNMMSDQLYYQTSSSPHLQHQSHLSHHQQVQQQHHQQHNNQDHTNSTPSHVNGSVKRKMITDGTDSSGTSSSSKGEGSATTTGKKKSSPPNGKKTKGRVKIKMEFIDNKLRRYTTFSKRKTGIMKKAYELSTLTGTQVMLLVASETGHVYTFATRKLQPMITSDAGKALIQTCLNSPDSVLSHTLPSRSGDEQRMCATGFEETDLTYTVNDNDNSSEKSPSNNNNNGFLSMPHCPTLFLESGGSCSPNASFTLINSNDHHHQHNQGSSVS